jgi:AraC family transcriptional regulator of adaptative response/methylated-DNA-[protein]-cysteine methyltransferase
VRAAQKVAWAVAAIPTPIVVPCHRVVGADGSLTGYRGGLWRKRALLDFEAGTSHGAGDPAGGLPAIIRAPTDDPRDPVRPLGPG